MPDLQAVKKEPLQMCCDPFLETKKGIAAANPSYVQEELLSSFLCIYYTVYAAAPQIFAEQKKQPVIWLLLYTTN